MFGRLLKKKVIEKAKEIEKNVKEEPILKSTAKEVKTQVHKVERKTRQEYGVSMGVFGKLGETNRFLVILTLVFSYFWVMLYYISIKVFGIFQLSPIIQQGITAALALCIAFGVSAAIHEKIENRYRY